MNITILELMGKLVKLKIQRFKDGRSTYDIYGNPLVLKQGMVFFMHMILIIN